MGCSPVYACPESTRQEPAPRMGVLTTNRTNDVAANTVVTPQSDCRIFARMSILNLQINEKSTKK